MCNHSLPHTHTRFNGGKPDLPGCLFSLAMDRCLCIRHKPIACPSQNSPMDPVHFGTRQPILHSGNKFGSGVPLPCAQLQTRGIGTPSPQKLPPASNRNRLELGLAGIFKMKVLPGNFLPEKCSHALPVARCKCCGRPFDDGR